MPRNDNSQNSERPAPNSSRLIDRREASEIAAVSIATWDRMNAGGKTPEPIHLSRGCVRWRLDDVQLWIRLGCPDRQQFEHLKNTQNH